MTERKNKDAIVLGATRGIGRAIHEALADIGINATGVGSSAIDTSDLHSVKTFAAQHPETDILVLNTGGPPAKAFSEISERDWQHSHNQLFLSFCLLLQQIHVRDNGYVFVVSSHVVREPDARLILSCAYRSAFVSVLKCLSSAFAERGISCINIAPGPIKTDRLKALYPNMNEYEATLPMKRAGRPEEIGKFVKALVENDIHYLSGTTVLFDGALSRFAL